LEACDVAASVTKGKQKIDRAFGDMAEPAAGRFAASRT
jgi:hypothetical protein